MRAVVCREFGPPEAHRVEEVPPPPLTPGTIRVKVQACALSFANLLVIEGKHQNTPPLPFTPGTEIAGTVMEIAPDVETTLKPGDRVCAGLPSGGLAEEAVIDAANVFPIPDGLDYAAATQFPTIYATAYASLVWRAHMQPGEVLLVHAAAGASGLAAVQIGKALGARVIATAGSPEKCAIAAEHGADHVIEYRADEFRKEVLALTEGRGADVIFDPVGGAVFDQSLRCIAPLGRIIPMGFASGDIPTIPANLVLVKNIDVIGIYWGFYMAWGKTQAEPALRAKVRTMFADLFALVEQGQLRPITDSELPLKDFAKSLHRLTERSVVGKVVLVP